MPHTHTHTHTHTHKFFICKSYIILKASPAPNGSIEKKLKSVEKCPNTAPPPKKKTTNISVPISEDRRKYKWKSDKSTLMLDFN